MRLAMYEDEGRPGLAASEGEGFFGVTGEHPDYPGDLDSLLAVDADLVAVGRRLLDQAPVDLARVKVLPPLRAPGKILCIGLNYADHSSESGFDLPDYPTVFVRFATTLVGQGGAILRPRVSDQLDFEGEMVAVIGRRGRHIEKSEALAHVAAYSLFNDASVRDYQFRSPQWTMGKNFDATGAFGPWLVTADELPAGAAGLGIRTRLNGETVQSSNTDQMIFDVATLVSLLSEVMTLEPGDIIVTGTPSGVGFARNPKLFMKAGDLCEVEVERIGTLRNPIADED